MVSRDSSMQDGHGRLGPSPLLPWRVTCPEEARKAEHQSSTHHEFSEATLSQLLRALRARSSNHPDNPGLIASWPGVREDRVAPACAELLSRGDPVFRVAIPSDNPSGTRDGRAVRGPGRGAGVPSEDAVTARAREHPR